MRWNPSKEEIKDYLSAKDHEFTLRETQGLRFKVERWKDRYIYTNMHEIFFVEFPCLLNEWLKRQVAINSDLWLLEPIFWDQAKLEELKVLDNKWTWTIDFWFSWVKEGYIIEFLVEYIDSFSGDERKFVDGPIKRMLEEILLWIKNLFVEKGLMRMEPDRMAD
jgi:hypothetical protein